MHPSQTDALQQICQQAKRCPLNGVSSSDQCDSTNLKIHSFKIVNLIEPMKMGTIDRQMKHQPEQFFLLVRDIQRRHCPFRKTTNADDFDAFLLLRLVAGAVSDTHRFWWTAGTNLSPSIVRFLFARYWTWRHPIARQQQPILYRRVGVTFFVPLKKQSEQTVQPLLAPLVLTLLLRCPNLPVNYVTYYTKEEIDLIFYSIILFEYLFS